MVRDYKRKSTRGSYGKEVLQTALLKVQAGEMSKRKAELTYGVPRKTLKRHLSGLVKKPGCLGRFSPVLSDEFEEALVEHAIQLQRMFFGLVPADLRKLAFELAEKLGLEHPFKNNKAGKSWFRNFFKRNPQLSMRNPEPTSLARAVGFNKPVVMKFFEIYKEELIKSSFSADRIWNADESGLTVVHTPGRIVAKRGDKQVGRITSGERGETVTIICAMNGAGNYAPPKMIFKRRRMNQLLLRGSPPGTIGGVSDNGWVTSDLFLQWLEHFIAIAKPTKEQKVILLVDGHASHKSLAVVEKARENGVVMLCFPPHTTHRIQPLDRCFFGPLKKRYNSECDKFMTTHPGQRISTYDIAELFTSSFMNSATMANAVNGFKCCGLWPYNPNVFKDEDFMPAVVTDEPLNIPQASSANVEISGPSTSVHAVDVIECDETGVTFLLPDNFDHEVEVELDFSTALPIEIVSDTNTPAAVAATVYDVAEASAVLEPSASSIVELLSPVPKIQKVRPRTRKAQTAAVITSSPYKAELQKKQELLAQKSHKKLDKSNTKRDRNFKLPDQQRWANYRSNCNLVTNYKLFKKFNLVTHYKLLQSFVQITKLQIT